MPQIDKLPHTLNNLIKAHFKKRELADIQVSPLTPDGSDRIYYRISSFGYDPVIAVDAKGTGLHKNHPSTISQNQTFILIREHLENLDFPVPELFSTVHNHDYYLLQDLGDNSLYNTIKKQGWSPETIKLYQSILVLLLNLQIVAKEKFDPSWCYAGGYYNRQLIHEHELNYFLKAFVVGYCEININHDITSKLQNQFNTILDAATGAPGDFFLYRDFQSKNLMLKEQKIFLIDFQGARLGPYYYDLAALINDPYIDMPWPLREQLKIYYFNKLQSHLNTGAPEVETFSYFFSLFSLIRTLQTLGAFGYLVTRNKMHFKAYIKPALKNLHYYTDMLSEHHNLQTLKSLLQKIQL